MTLDDYSALILAACDGDQLNAKQRRRVAELLDDYGRQQYQKGVTAEREACIEVAMMMPLKDAEPNDYRSSDDCKAIAWDIGVAIRRRAEELF